MEDGNLAILVDAKTEYTKQLVNIISPYIYTGIKNIYIEAKEECFERDEMENTLRTFQKRLSGIPKWNQEVIDEEYNTIITESKCDWLEDLIMAVFVSHTRILTSINFNKSKNKVDLKIPKVDHFIHQCYIEVARCFWKNPYLFDDTINKYEFQRNRREAEQLIETQIHETIRRQLPVKNILREYLGTDYREVEEQEDDIETDSTYNDNLRKLVKAEIENCSKEKLEQFNIEGETKNEENTEPEVVEEPKDTEKLLEDTTESSQTETAVEDAEPPPAVEESITTPAVEESKTSPAVEESKTPPALEDNSEATPTNVEEVDSSLALENTESNPPVVEDEAALSDNEIEKQEVTDIIEKEVEKLEMEPLDNGLEIEELNLDIDDLSLLEEVYQDTPKTPEPVQEPVSKEHDLPEGDKTIDLLKDKTENIKMEVKTTEETPIKTIIIDTKKGSKVLNSNNDLEINDYDDNEGSDSEDEESRMKQKVYNRYSKNRDYSFFN